jgi:hypothetical protein
MAVPPIQLAGPAPGHVVCCECGKEFPAEDTLQFGQRHVCAACKPVFLQRLGEGAPPRLVGGNWLSVEEVLARDYPISLGRAWDRAWLEFRKEPWMLMAALVIYGALLVAAAGIGAVGGFVVPLAQNILQLFIGGQLTAGIYLVFLLRMRGEAVNLSAGFRGFGPRYWQLTLCQVVQFGVTLALMVLGGAGLAPVVILGLRAQNNSSLSPAALIAIFAAGGLLAMVAVAVLFYYMISWLFALPLILDKGLDFWPAMKLSRAVINRHAWLFSWLLLVTSIFAALGAALCGVGIVFTGTIAVLMLCSVYEDMFGDLAPQRRS